MHDVRIEMTGPGRGKVFVDGQEMRCSEIGFHAKVNQPNRVALRLIADKVEITGPAEVVEERHRGRPSATTTVLVVIILVLLIAQLSTF